MIKVIRANSHPGDIVIYPHPPARVEAAHIPCQLLYQVEVAAVGRRAPEIKYLEKSVVNFHIWMQKSPKERRVRSKKKR